MTDVAWMYGKHSLPNTQPQNQIISLSFSPALNPWAGLGAGDRVSPCLAGDVEGRMKSSQLASKSQDKGKEEREEVCIPSFLSQTQHFKQRHFFSEGMKRKQEWHADLVPLYRAPKSEEGGITATTLTCSGMQKILQWAAISLSRESSRPRDWTHVSCVSCTGRWILYHCTNDKGLFQVKSGF